MTPPIPEELGRMGYFVREVVCSEDGARLAACDEDREVAVFPLDGTGEPFRARAHRDAVYCLASCGPRGFVSGSWDRTVRSWCSEGLGRSFQGHTERVERVLRVGDRVLSADEGGTVLAHELRTGLPVGAWRVHLNRVRALVPWGDGWLTVGDDGRLVGEQDGIVTQRGWWSSALYGLAAHGRGWLATTAAGELVAWDHGFDGARQLARDVAYLRWVVLSPRGTLAACGGKSGRVLIVDLASGSVVAEVSFGRGTLRGVWIDDERLVVVGRSGLLCWMTTHGAHGTWEGAGTDHLFTIALVPGGFATGGFDGRVLRWRLAS